MNDVCAIALFDFHVHTGLSHDGQGTVMEYCDLAARQGMKAIGFCEHVDLRAVNRATIEALIKCGAFDSLGAHRAAMTAALDQAIELGQAAAADRRSGQMSLFAAPDHAGADAPPVRFPNVEPWSEAQLLAAEKETLGFYITSHPLTHYGRELASLSSPAGICLARLEDTQDGAQVTIGCMLASVRPRVVRNGRYAGKKMALLTIEDLTAKCEAVVFTDAYEKYGELIQPDAMVFLAGSVDRHRDKPNIKVHEVIPIDEALGRLTGSLLLRLPPGGDGDFLRRLHDVLVRHKGPAPVLVQVRPVKRPDVLVTVRLDRRWSVEPTRGLVSELVGLLGEENLVLRAKPQTGPNGGQGAWKAYSRRAAPRRLFTPSPAQAVVSEAVTRFD